MEFRFCIWKNSRGEIFTMMFDKIPFDLYVKLYDDYVVDFYYGDEALTPSSFKDFWDDLTEEERQKRIDKVLQ